MFLQSFFTESNGEELLDAFIGAPGLHEFNTEELLPDLLKRFLNEEGLLDSDKR